LYGLHQSLIAAHMEARLKTFLRIVTIFALALGTSIAFHGRVGADEVQAFASLVNSNGDFIGQAKFVELGSGNVRVTVDVSGLRPGLHGMHIHSVGSCIPSDFVSAGSHFNPGNRKHGLQTSDGPHAGDLPNLVAKSDG